MNWWKTFLSIFFPSKVNYFKLTQIPTSPPHTEPHWFSFFDYHSTQGKALIYHLKKYRDPLLIQCIAAYIHHDLLEALSELQQFNYFQNPLIIPIPITQKRKRERGFNQSHELAQELARLYKGRFASNILIKVKETQKQALISQRHKRYMNVKNSFDVTLSQRHLLHNQDIILVDDLITSGATIKEALRILYKYKVRNIMVISIAH
ncbi:MAG: hypothetical protein MRY57_00570 [Candidatus Pacebacteria bacterium]|nr:hypothetical protein [Candidatus Paceibacterota bacterium]